MSCLGWKGGIGTASRSLSGLGCTAGVLVLANFGSARLLRMDGVPIGQLLPGESPPAPAGSCIVVVATDAALGPAQLERVARRAGLGLARTGSVAHNGSGEIFLAFSTARREGVDGRELRRALRGDRRRDRGGRAERALGGSRRRRAARDGCGAASRTTRCSSCSSSTEPCRGEDPRRRHRRRRQRGRGGRAEARLLRAHDVRRPRPRAPGGPRRPPRRLALRRRAGGRLQRGEHRCARDRGRRRPQRGRPALQPADLRGRLPNPLHLPRHGDDALGAAPRGAVLEAGRDARRPPVRRARALEGSRAARARRDRRRARPLRRLRPLRRRPPLLRDRRGRRSATAPTW